MLTHHHPSPHRLLGTFAALALTTGFAGGQMQNPSANETPPPKGEAAASKEAAKPREAKPQGDILIDPEALERERMRRNLEWEPLETRRKKSGGGLRAYLHDELKYCGYYETAEGRKAGFRVGTEIGLLFGRAGARVWNGRIVEITPDHVTVAVKTRPSDKKETTMKIYRETRRKRGDAAKQAVKP